MTWPCTNFACGLTRNATASAMANTWSSPRYICRIVFGAVQHVIIPARTLAIDPSSGDVYLTSVIYGAEMNTPMTNGRPASLKVSPVDSSFQVLVVGN